MRMRSLPILLSALLLSCPGIACAQAPVARATEQNALAGLWQARLRFGPEAAGRLIIVRHGAGFRAEIAGRVVPVRREGDLLAFDLPGDRGAFRGRLEGGAIRGRWIRPGTPANDSRYESPVMLRAEAPGRWEGDVATLRDTFTFYLLLRPGADGALQAVLRNPERDVGTQWGVRRLVREGDALRLMGARGNGSERVVANGRFDAETGGFTLVFRGRGGSYDFVRNGDQSDFYPRGREPGHYAYAPPLALSDGWPVATLDQTGIDRPAIERLVQSILDRPMDSTDAPQTHALLIARRGRLVLEEYFHGMGRDDLHDLRSASKSLSAVTIGAAMRAGAPLSLSSPVYQVMNGGAFPPALEAQRRSMTLEHLLTMSGGFFCDDTNDQAPGNEDVMTEQTAEPDWYRYTLAVPMATPPGENSVYCSASPNLALGMLGAATGRSPLDEFDRLVAGPMGIDHYAWPLDPLGRPYGGGSVQLRARDFLKFGQLMLNGGTWRGRRVLDPAFAAAAVAPHYHLRNNAYGYLWWVEDLPYRDRMVRAYSMRGAGGNWVLVVPALDLVVAIMSGNYSSRTQLTYTANLIPRSILPAVRSRGDDPNAPVADRDFTTPYGRSTDGSRIAPAATDPRR